MAYLDEVVIAAPCPMSWDSMIGDDRVRHCSGCAKNVYNIGDMTDKEAEQFFEENGTTQCVRFFRRSDGKLMTDNCPKGLRAIRNRCRLALKVGAGLAASIFAFIPNLRGASVFAQDAKPAEVDHSKDLKGDVYVPRANDGKTPVPEVRVLGGKPMMNRQEIRGNVAVPPQTKKIMIDGSCPSKQSSTGTNETPGILQGRSSIAPSNIKNSTPATTPATAPASQKSTSPISAPASKPSSSPAKTKKSGEELFPKKSDSRAHVLYLQAVENENHGKLLLAQTQYKDSIRAAELQQDGDPHFLKMLQRSLDNVQTKILHSNTNLAASK